jgi:hypothetical protein
MLIEHGLSLARGKGWKRSQDNKEVTVQDRSVGEDPSYSVGTKSQSQISSGIYLPPPKGPYEKLSVRGAKP